MAVKNGRPEGPKMVFGRSLGARKGGIETGTEFASYKLAEETSE
jgi:hypothetical protein